MAVVTGGIVMPARETEAAGAYTAALALLQHRPPRASRQDGAGVGKNPRREVGKRIQHRRNEHVAGDAADGVEMDQHHLADRR
jgi:thiamine monophosphate kinase